MIKNRREEKPFRHDLESVLSFSAIEVKKEEKEELSAVSLALLMGWRKTCFLDPSTDSKRSGH